jgi:hypothetical protein
MRTQVRRWRFVACAVGGAALAAACGSGGSYDMSSSTPTTVYSSGSASTAPAYTSSPTPTRPGSTTDYRQLYLNVTSSTNNATTTFDVALTRLGNNPTAVQLRVIADPLAGALDTLRQNLVATAWPPSVAADIKTLAGAVAVMVKQLRSVDSTRDFDAPTWIGNVRTDEANIVDDAGLVRKDLGAS